MVNSDKVSPVQLNDCICTLAGLRFEPKSSGSRRFKLGFKKVGRSSNKPMVSTKAINTISDNRLSLLLNIVYFATIVSTPLWVANNKTSAFLRANNQIGRASCRERVQIVEGAGCTK